MGRLLQSDFYRLFKSKSYYICTLIAMLLVAGSAFLMDWSYRMMSQTEGLSVVATPFVKDGITYGLMMFSGGDVHIFLAIFIAIFVTAEYAHGTMKNAVSKGFPKYQIYVSKLITMITASFIMIVLMFLISTISATIITGTLGTFTGTYIGQMFAMIGVELLLHAALASVFVMVANTVRNNGGVIAINIIGITFGPLLYQLLEMLFKSKIKFTEFSLRNSISIYTNNIAPLGEDVLRAIIVGLVFFVVSTAVGIFAFKNMDVK